MLEALISIFILFGAAFVLIGSIGLARLPDFYTRLHAPTKATTLGLGAILIGSALYFSAHSGHISVHEILITLFLFMTAPVSAHLLARVGLHLKVRSLAPPPERYADRQGR